MMPDYYAPLQAGDTAFTPVTDHPNFSRVFREGEYCLFRDQAVAERIAAAWDSYLPADAEWRWYVKAVVLLPREEPEPEPEDTGQLSLW